MVFWEYWDPFEELERMRRRMRHVMRGLQGEEFFEGTFPVDISETDEGLIVKADLPGFDKTDIAIRATENTLEITAQHKEKKIERTEKMYRAERRFGALRRILTLPVEVKVETSKTRFENGVLEIRFKKAKPTKKAKEIKIE